MLIEEIICLHRIFLRPLKFSTNVQGDGDFNHTELFPFGVWLSVVCITSISKITHCPTA